tara:strand:+ start:26 stop:547 length:522 start_codon:yes stop_codon:yes gene_type:complete
MGHINVEIKAECNNPQRIKDILKLYNAEYKGTDNQIDTYFNVNNGRLKIRQGNIENYLIYYERDNDEGPKQSDVILTSLNSENRHSLLNSLIESLGVLVIVDKDREIYFIDNVKFHIDEVQDLGSFVEIEAIDREGNLGRERLEKQCNHYMNLLGIKEENLISISYSDMLLEK